MSKVWELKDTISAVTSDEIKECNIHEVVVEILRRRKILSADDLRLFLYGTMQDEFDPFLMKGMEEAVARIKQAIADGEKILIHGDYDVDGVTAAALLAKTFDDLGASYALYLPERLKGGYGVSEKAIYYARDIKAKLVVTVDCGITAYEEVELAHRFGLEVIITDHHRPLRDELPKAYCIVNPWQKDCSYPFKELSGVGVTYKLSRALGVQAQNKYLDLVAFGTVCDISPLISENRLLVKYGLKKFDEGVNLGLTALRKIAGVKTKKMNTGHLGFIFGPRINASGRLGSAECALRLLISDNEREAKSLATVLDEENKERQRLEKVILKEAERKVEKEINFNKDKVIVIWSNHWHTGVIGIVAQRIVEKYNRPTIVISIDRDLKVGRGSGRSLKTFNLFEALSFCSDYFIEFGGHEYAAGIEIAEENLESFRDRINEYTRTNYTNDMFLKRVSVDAEISLPQINKGLIEGLELLEPFGRANPKPVFLSKNLVCKERSIYLSKNTLKFWVTNGECTYEAIWYRAAEDVHVSKGDTLDIIFNLVQRRWFDREVIVLEVKDIKIKR